MRPSKALSRFSAVAVTGAVALAVAGAPTALAQSMTASPLVTPFSDAKPGASLPPGWAPIKINDQKKPTVYDFVDDGGTVVLHASADAAASLVGFKTQFDLNAAPVMSWRWKVSRLIATADNSVASKEDSPVRIVLEFDGDKSKLSFADRSTIATGKILSGRELPYATLMYVWCNQRPAGTVIRSPRTERIRKLVVESGKARLNRWLDYERDIRADYQRVFGEAPGALVGMAIMTDSDNTGSRARAWYGPVQIAH